MAWSNPILLGATIPEEMPPQSSYSVRVEVQQQDAPDPWASNHNCTKGTMITGWETPVKLVVDGVEMDRDQTCLGSSGDKGTVRVTIPGLSPGTHDIKLQALSVGGSAYDTADPDPEINDTITAEITVSEDAEDPSLDRDGDLIERLIEMLGGSKRSLLMAGAIAFAVFMVI